MEKEFAFVFLGVVILCCVLVAGCTISPDVTIAVNGEENTSNSPFTDPLSSNSSSDSYVNESIVTSGKFEVTYQNRSFFGAYSSEDPIIGSWYDMSNLLNLKILGTGEAVLMQTLDGMREVYPSYLQWGKMEGDSGIYLFKDIDLGDVYKVQFNNNSIIIPSINATFDRIFGR